MCRSLGLSLLLMVLASSPAAASLIRDAAPSADAAVGFEWRDDSFRAAPQGRLLPGGGDDTNPGRRVAVAPPPPELFADKDLAIVFGHRDQRALVAFYGAPFRDRAKRPWFDDDADGNPARLFDHEVGTMLDVAFVWPFIPVSSSDPVETLAESNVASPLTPSDSSVPEPASVALLGMGLFILGVLSRRKAKVH